MTMAAPDSLVPWQKPASVGPRCSVTTWPAFSLKRLLRRRAALSIKEGTRTHEHKLEVPGATRRLRVR